MGIIETLDANEWLGLNARLQTKKNALRKALKEKGILKKGGTNTFDKYSYFTEAQYKELFTELFSDAGLELSFNEVEYNTFTGSEKQANGRMPKLNFILTDIDTGFYEETTITGEGIDKGDKAGYKAYTGALKYYLANTFMVATGDDPEEDSPAHTMNDKQEKKATEKQIELMKKIAAEQGKNLDEAAVKNWTMKQASDFISKYKGVK
jgi:hypothetical protein